MNIFLMVLTILIVLMGFSIAIGARNLAGILFGSIVILLMTGVMFGFTSNKQDDQDDKSFTEVYQLMVLQDNDNLNGRFFLGTGSINEVSYYYVMIKEGERMKFRKLRAEKWDLVEKENVEPRLEVTKKPIRFAFLEFLQAVAEEELGISGKKGIITDRVIYVPKGSVIQNYKVDLQSGNYR